MCLPELSACLLEPSFQILFYTLLRVETDGVIIRVGRNTVFPFSSCEITFSLTYIFFGQGIHKVFALSQ